MSITLTQGATTIQLPDDILWADRYSWSPVSQTVTPSITGASIIDIGTRVAGRPITLVSDETHAWITYADTTLLKTWAATPGCEMALSIFGTTYTVIWRHHEAPALELIPIVDYSVPDAADYFFGTLKLMEI